VTILDAFTTRRRAQAGNTVVRKPLAETISTTVRSLTARATAAKTRFRRPALTIGALGCVDAAFFQHGWFAGLLCTGISLFVFEAMGGDDE
jgi:hypothetical protein